MPSSGGPDDGDLPKMAKDFYESRCVRQNPENERISLAQNSKNSVAECPTTQNSVAAECSSDASSCRSKVRREGCQENGQTEKDENDEEERSDELRKRLWMAMSMDALMEQRCQEDVADETVAYHPVHSPFSVRPRFMRFGTEPRTMMILFDSPENCRGYGHHGNNRPAQEQDEELETLPARLEEETNSPAELDQSRQEEEEEGGGTEENQKVSEFAPSMPLAKRIFVVVASVLAMTICISAATPALFPSLYENRPEPAVEILKTLEAIWPDIAWLPCPWSVSDAQRHGSFRNNRSLIASKISMDSAPAIQEILVSAVAAVDRVPLVLHKMGKQIMDWCKSFCDHLFQDPEAEDFPPILEEMWGCGPQPELMSVNSSVQTYSSNFSRPEKRTQPIAIEDPRDGSQLTNEVVDFSNDFFCKKEHICYEPIDAKSVQGSLRYSQVRLEDFYHYEQLDSEGFINNERFNLKKTPESLEATGSETVVEVDFSAPQDLGESTVTSIPCMAALQEITHLGPLNQDLKPASECQSKAEDDVTAFEKPDAPISDEPQETTSPGIHVLVSGEDKIEKSAGDMDGNVAMVKGEPKEKMAGELKERKSLLGSLRQNSSCGWTRLMAVIAGFCMLPITFRALIAFLREGEHQLPKNKSILAVNKMLQTSLPVSSRNSTSPYAKTVGPIFTEYASPLSPLGSYIEYIQSPGKVTPVRRSSRLRSLALSPSSHKLFP